MEVNEILRISLPDVETKAFDWLQCFHVETDRGQCWQRLIQMHLVQYSCLSDRIQAEQQNASRVIPQWLKYARYLRQEESHLRWKNTVIGRVLSFLALHWVCSLQLLVRLVNNYLVFLEIEKNEWGIA